MDVFPLYGTSLLKLQRKNTFNEYNRNNLIKQLQNALDNKNNEVFFNIIAELHVSFLLNDIYEFAINNLKNIILSNISYAFFFDKNIKKIIKIIKTFDKNIKKESVINSIEIRNVFAEIFINLINGNDSKSIDQKILEKKYFSEENIIKNSNLSSYSKIIDKNNKILPNLTTRGIREIRNFIDNSKSFNFSNIRYWICWTIEVEKKERKSVPILFKNFIFLEGIKYFNDFTLYLWSKLLKSSKKKKNNIYLIVKSLYSIYTFNYKPSKKKKREYLFSVALYIHNNNLNINIKKNITPLSLFTSLKINIFYKSVIEEKNNPDNKYCEKVINKNNTKKHEKESKENIERYHKAKINRKMEYLNELVYKNKIEKNDKITDFFLIKK